MVVRSINKRGDSRRSERFTSQRLCGGKCCQSVGKIREGINPSRARGDTRKLKLCLLGCISIILESHKAVTQRQRRVGGLGVTACPGNGYTLNNCCAGPLRSLTTGRRTSV